jgi:hypothetical protein
VARLSPAGRHIIDAQGLRTAGYGCTSVLLSGLLAARSYSPLTTGLALACVVAGTAWGPCSSAASRTASGGPAGTPRSTSASPEPG